MITFTTKALEGLASLNDPAQWILALVVLVTGILVMEVLLLYIRGWIRATQTKQTRPDIWRLNLSPDISRVDLSATARRRTRSCSKSTASVLQQSSCAQGDSPAG
ncbi:MAG: hypothetical protein ACLFS7_00590 [Desulfosudaceae bacterium]